MFGAAHQHKPKNARAMADKMIIYVYFIQTLNIPGQPKNVFTLFGCCCGVWFWEGSDFSTTQHFLQIRPNAERPNDGYIYMFVRTKGGRHNKIVNIILVFHKTSIHICM